MKKKVFLLLVGLCLGLCVLAGCGGEKAPNPYQQEMDKQEQEQAKPALEDIQPTEPKNAEGNIVMNEEIKFGMSQRKVKELETRFLSDEQMNYLLYTNPNGDYEFGYSGDPVVDSVGASKLQESSNYELYIAYKYYFDGDGDDERTNKLIAYNCSMRTSLKGVDYYHHYLDIKKILTEKFGECVYENYTWYDEEAKADEASWNKAFQEGDFSILTVWQLNTMTITVNWDAEKDISIEYKAIPGTY